MSALLHSLLIAIAILLAFIWIKIPGLSLYSLQAFFLAILIYFIYKRLTRAALWHIVPRSASWEMALITFALLLLIGSTGNLHSWLYPLTYLHLFFLVLACELGTVLFATALIMLFHFALTPGLTLEQLPHLLTLPLILLCFLFAKEQYDQANQDRELLNEQEDKLAHLTATDNHWHNFVTSFLQPKLETILQLAKNPQENRAALEGQVALLKLEVAKNTTAALKKKAEVSSKKDSTWPDIALD